jgi:hypothetical protein
VNRRAKRIPQVDEVANHDALGVLRRDFARQQGGSDTALDPRDLRLDTRAQAIAVLVVKCRDAFFLDVADGLVMPARLFMAEGVWKLFSYRRRRACLTDQSSLADQAGANVANRAQKSPSRP